MSELHKKKERKLRILQDKADDGDSLNIGSRETSRHCRNRNGEF
jgi:hypothetical protein